MDIRAGADREGVGVGVSCLSVGVCGWRIKIIKL